GAGSAVDEPMPTICANGSHQRLVTAHVTAMAQNVIGYDPRDALPTVLAGAQRFGVVECMLSPEQEAGALRVAAFLMRYYGTGGQHGDLDEPLATVTTKDRLALVTVHLSGVPYVIVDIGLRMLKPHELFRAQGFPASYIIDRTQDGRQVSNSRAVAMVGNSVSPPPLIAILEANVGAAVEPQLEAA
ncbi:DNA cytosine methyltransferase, partial [Stenotrophomonas maltophilia]